MKSHYDTLDIHPDSSLAEIKKKFRALSLRFHPDLSKTKVSSNGEKFKQISAAYAVLSHKRDRKLYDLELEDLRKFGRKRGGTGNSGMGRTASGMAYRFQVLEGIFKPKNMVLGLGLGFFTVAAFKSLAGIENEESILQKNKRETGKKKLVEAWYNAKTKKWEQPTPWKQSFRDLKPEIKLVPREKLNSSSPGGR
mmetsp:Transcript_23628/g.35083  ORF Transcript_23628/g.35083 Transcript_23628/m.35083 type:complete len:195 (-) Transcript_23628:294-878(-)